MIGYPNSEHYISSVDGLSRERRIYPMEPSLDHPNILSVYAFEVENDTP